MHSFALLLSVLCLDFAAGQNVNCALCGGEIPSTISKPNEVISIDDPLVGEFGDQLSVFGVSEASCSLIRTATETFGIVPAQTCSYLQGLTELQVRCGCVFPPTEAPTDPLMAAPTEVPTHTPVTNAPIVATVPMAPITPASVPGPSPIMQIPVFTPTTNAPVLAPVSVTQSTRAPVQAPVTVPLPAAPVTAPNTAHVVDPVSLPHPVPATSITAPVAPQVSVALPDPSTSATAPVASPGLRPSFFVDATPYTGSVNTGTNDNKKDSDSPKSNSRKSSSSFSDPSISNSVTPVALNTGTSTLNLVTTKGSKKSNKSGRGRSSRKRHLRLSARRLA